MNSDVMEPSSAATAAQFGHLFNSWRHHHSGMELSHAYRYNHNMMEYYTCKTNSWFLSVFINGHELDDHVFRSSENFGLMQSLKLSNIGRLWISTSRRESRVLDS